MLVFSRLRNCAAMTEEQDDAWRDAFAMFDKNNDGHISEKELGVVTRGLGLNPSEKQLKQMMKEVKKNHNGMIEYEDFKKLMKKQSKSREKEKDDMIRAFRMFDKDGNNYIDKKELKRVMSELGETLSEDEISEMLRIADSNKDGKIDYQEFASFLLKQ
ncbi:hypothetical protein ScPMuIL_008375 [Solemya velum]